MHDPILASVDAKIAALQQFRESYVAARAAGLLGPEVDISTLAQPGSLAMPVGQQPAPSGPVELPTGVFRGNGLADAIRLYLSIAKRKQTPKEIKTALMDGGLATTENAAPKRRRKRKGKKKTADRGERATKPEPKANQTKPKKAKPERVEPVPSAPIARRWLALLTGLSFGLSFPPGASSARGNLSPLLLWDILHPTLPALFSTLPTKSGHVSRQSRGWNWSGSLWLGLPHLTLYN